jgi:hypothetical protein
MYNQGGRGGKKDWGYIDLLGCGFADDPVVIELKILRFNKGGKPRPETPLRAVVEALAYAISLRESWAIFHPQWKLGVGSQRALAKPSGLSLVVLGTTGYWKGVGESSWIEQAEQAMPEFIAAVKAEGFPCHFAEIDAECVSSKNRNWIIKGPAKEISPW